MFVLSGYLARIGLAAAPLATPEGLSCLVAAQMRAIAFENTDPLLGVLPDPGPEAIWAKLVEARRGGYCFELNGLFGQALAALGLVARPILGRVRMGAAEGGARSHLAFLVTLEGTAYLADAGFGGPGPDAAIPLGEAGPTVTPGGDRFRLRPDAATGETVLERATPDGWFALYSFDAARVTQADIEAANLVCAQAAFSPFPQHLMVGRMTDGGRAGLFDDRLTGAGPERRLRDAADLCQTLHGVFGLPDDAGLAERLWARIGGGRDRRAA